MAIEDGLGPGDKERGIILACQAKATGNVTVEARRASTRLISTTEDDAWPSY